MDFRGASLINLNSGFYTMSLYTYLTDDRLIPSDPIDDEDGDYRGKEDREHRLTAEQDKNRVLWNVERRSYLESSATKRFASYDAVLETVQINVLIIQFLLYLDSQ